MREAQDRVLRRFSPLSTEDVPLGESIGRVLAEEIRAPRDVPPFANSSMDGFALRASSTAGASREAPKELPVTAHIAAGSNSSVAISEGETARIMTGAPLPEGADAVIPFEEVEDRGESIAVFDQVSHGASVRPAGNDFKAGQSLLAAGTEIRPPQIALLGSIGKASVKVYRRPRVAVLSTGDELVSPGEQLRPGQIYNSNTPMLAAAVREAGGEPLVIETVRDDPRLITEAIHRAQSADLLITSGGASVGDFDHMTDIIQSGNVGFWKVRLRPGKPLIFGSIGDVPVLGLPGNPTSSMVTFEQFVRPVIRKMLGANPFRPEIEAIVDERIDNRGGRETYARVRLTWKNGQAHALLSGRQDSAMLLPLAHADGLLRIPEEITEMQPGDLGQVQLWGFWNGA